MQELPPGNLAGVGEIEARAGMEKSNFSKCCE